MFHLKEFSKKFMNMDPEAGAVAFAFVIACMIWASPLFFLRDNVLGKIIMVGAIIALTMYHRIAGLIAVIAIIAVLNQTAPMKEGMVSSPAPSITFNSPDEFRQKYCVKGYPDDPTQPGKMILNYMLSPAFFTKMDASGNPIMSKEQIDALGVIDPTSFNKCTPLKLSNGGTEYETIHNMCDPTCGWTMKSVAPVTAPTEPTATAAPTAATAAPTAPTAATEGFTPMLRPHIRTGRRLVTNGLNNLKSGANRLKRQLF